MQLRDKSRTKGWRFLVTLKNIYGIVFIFSAINFFVALPIIISAVEIILSLSNTTWWEQKQNARRHNKV